jgi:hypothetical protein
MCGIKVFRSSRGQMKGEEGVFRYCYCGLGRRIGDYVAS